jgi:hypothetical protein
VVLSTNFGGLFNNLPLGDVMGFVALCCTNPCLADGYTLSSKRRLQVYISSLQIINKAFVSMLNDIINLMCLSEEHLDAFLNI